MAFTVGYEFISGKDHLICCINECVIKCLSKQYSICSIGSAFYYCGVRNIMYKKEPLLTVATNVLFLQVYDILNSAELVCLMRYISVPSPFGADCMVAANPSCKKTGIWIGSGNLEAAQISFIDLNSDGHRCQVSVKAGA